MNSYVYGASLTFLQHHCHVMYSYVKGRLPSNCMDWIRQLHESPVKTVICHQINSYTMNKYMTTWTVIWTADRWYGSRAHLKELYRCLNKRLSELFSKTPMHRLSLSEWVSESGQNNMQWTAFKIRTSLSLTLVIFYTFRSVTISVWNQKLSEMSLQFPH